MIAIDGVFLLVALVLGKFIDWVFQNSWQVYWKSKFGENWGKALTALVSHSLIYATFTAVALENLFHLTGWRVINMWLVLLISHIVIDNLYLVKFIFRLKGYPRESLDNYYESAWAIAGVQQILVDVSIIIAAMYVGKVT